MPFLKSCRKKSTGTVKWARGWNFTYYWDQLKGLIHFLVANNPHTWISKKVLKRDTRKCCGIPTQTHNYTLINHNCYCASQSLTEVWHVPTPCQNTNNSPLFEMSALQTVFALCPVVHMGSMVTNVSSGYCLYEVAMVTRLNRSF